MTHDWVQTDATFLETALPELQDYLLSDELHWNLGPDLPTLTIGNILLALTRLEAASPASALEMRKKVNTLRQKWRVAWMKKAARETANRLRLWSQFLSEQQSAQESTKSTYAADVRGRVILQLLLKETPGAPEKLTLADLDAFLRARFLTGDFVWEETYLSAFPADEFWFLYGSL